MYVSGRRVYGRTTGLSGRPEVTAPKDVERYLQQGVDVIRVVRNFCHKP